MHVVDVSDINHPRKVAEYAVPEAGSHNMWVENDILYMGYYTGGGRVLAVTGIPGNPYTFYFGAVAGQPVGGRPPHGYPTD